jgi:hypothetical protein
VFIEVQAEILMPQTNRIERRKTNRFVILNYAERGSNGFRESFSQVEKNDSGNVLNGVYSPDKI